jgi:hypothetical protein
MLRHQSPFESIERISSVRSPCSAVIITPWGTWDWIDTSLPVYRILQ